MSNTPSLVSDYDRPVHLGENVFWVGVYDVHSHSHSNSFLVVEQDQAILIDGGGRSAFARVVVKIIQSGIAPSNVGALVFQNYNPHYTGSISHLQGVIGRRDLKIISDRANQIFVQHDSESGVLLSLEDIQSQLSFSSGRRLDFIKMPFAHSAGSFATFDSKSGILFTGDLFGSYASAWDLFLQLAPKCRTCEDTAQCQDEKDGCPIRDILTFHRDIMASERALRFALDCIAKVPFTTIAPHHGGIIRNPDDIIRLCELLSSLKNVGIDGVIGERSFLDLGDTRPIREHLGGK